MKYIEREGTVVLVMSQDDYDWLIDLARTTLGAGQVDREGIAKLDRLNAQNPRSHA